MDKPPGSRLFIVCGSACPVRCLRCVSVLGWCSGVRRPLTALVMRSRGIL